MKKQENIRSTKSSGGVGGTVKAHVSNNRNIYILIGVIVLAIAGSKLVG